MSRASFLLVCCFCTFSGANKAQTGVLKQSSALRVGYEYSVRDSMTGKMFILVILICWFPDFCHSSNDLSTEYSKYACEGSLLSIACPQNYVIQIVSFNYGRLSASVCVNQWSNGNLQCRSAPSKGIVSTRCNGLPQCDVPVSNNLFGDPCYGTSKYGEVQYICKRTQTVVFTKLACEDDILSFSCPTNQVIQIVNFNYGRLSPAVCVNRWSNNNLNCKAPWSKDVVSTRCNGLQSCEFHVNNANFGDPCYGTSKYGEVMYSCE